jgi:amino-acid N-acetyltransferase
MRTETMSETCVQLRPAEPADLPAVLALLSQAKLPTQGVESRALQDFIVAEGDGKLVGVVGLEIYRESALLRSAAVDPNWRGTGVGRALVERALDLSRERGIRDVFLLTTTAEGYFPRFGFCCVNRDAVPEAVRASVEFREACPASAVVMRKTMAV